MGLFRRLPANARPKLDRNERIVAWASTSDNAGAVVVTTFGVWLPGRESRLSWHRIHKATWAGTQLTVIASVEVGTGTGYTVMADDTPVRVGLAKPDDVPGAVRERVTKSVAYTAHHELPGGGVRVVGRRVPGVNGIEWHVRYDDGTDPSDPEVVALTTGLVADAATPADPDA